MEPNKALITARAAPETVQSQREVVRCLAGFMELLNALPGSTAILNSHGQILVANAAFARFADSGEEALVGKKPGEAWSCVCSKSKRGGCGAAVGCRTCGVALAIRECANQSAVRDARIERENDAGVVGNVDLRICARLLQVADQHFTVLSVEDVSAEKQRYGLERIFYHELLNTATGMEGLASLLVDAPNTTSENRSMAKWIRFSAGQFTDAVNAQRMLSSAQFNTLTLAPETVDLRALLAQTVQFYTSHDLARGCAIHILPEGIPTVESDPNVLNRVLLNLLKAAVEDSLKGQTVTLSATAERDCVRIGVHTPIVLEDEVKAQFSSRSVLKGTNRELLGCAVYLLTERFLGGQVSVESVAPEGTTFAVTLPLKWWKSST